MPILSRYYAISFIVVWIISSRIIICFLVSLENNFFSSKYDKTIIRWKIFADIVILLPETILLHLSIRIRIQQKNLAFNYYEIKTTETIDNFVEIISNCTNIHW
jgi:hypothetical protein